MPQPNQYIETIITSTGTINNLVAYTGFIRFTGSGSVVLTGKDSTPNQAEQGINLLIRNETGQALTIKHLSTSSDNANQFYILGEVDLPIADKGTAEFYYSNTLQLWILTNAFGNSFSPQYIDDANKVVTLVGDGTTKTQDVIEIEIVRDDITTDQTSADLNTLYPDAALLQKIFCPNLVNGGGFYTLIDAANKVWAFTNITSV